MCSHGFVDLGAELQKIYDSEINIRISWLWDGGIEVWLGDEMNGFLAQETVGSAGEIAPWLQEAIAHFYPQSKYSASLDQDVRQRAATRLFVSVRGTASGGATASDGEVEACWHQEDSIAGTGTGRKRIS